MKKKLPKCKCCGNRFVPFFNNSLQKYCTNTDPCIQAQAEYAKKEREKVHQKAWDKEKKEISFKIASPGAIAKTLQDPINKIARLIDKDQPCMMCGNPIKKTFGCHYHSVGSNTYLRFHLLNIWAGCYSCNGNMGGNIPGYDVQLVNTYGKEKWEYIKFDIVRDVPPTNLTKEEMKELASEARKIVRELEKADLKYPANMRWKLREQINKRLGIYTAISPT